MQPPEITQQTPLDASAGYELEAAFARLNVLTEQVAVMAEKNTRLLRAQKARKLLELQELAGVLRAEHERYREIIDTATRAARKANDAGNEAEFAKNIAITRMYSELDATRIAPLERSERAYAAYLATYAAEEDASASDLAPEHLSLLLQEAALTDASYNELLSEVDDFREEFESLFALCSQAEQDSVSS